MTYLAMARSSQQVLLSNQALLLPSKDGLPDTSEHPWLDMFLLALSFIRKSCKNANCCWWWWLQSKPCTASYQEWRSWMPRPRWQQSTPCTGKHTGAQQPLW